MRYRGFEKEKNQEEKNKDLHISFSLCCRKKKKRTMHSRRTQYGVQQIVFILVYSMFLKKGCEDKQNTEPIKSLNM